MKTSFPRHGTKYLNIHTLITANGFEKGHSKAPFSVNWIFSIELIRITFNVKKTAVKVKKKEKISP